MNRTTDKPKKTPKNAKNDRFFDDPIVQQRLAKYIQSHIEGKTVKLSPEREKDFFDVSVWD